MALTTRESDGRRRAVPAYLLDHDDPASLFTRLQRVGIHLELLQQESMRELPISFRDFVVLATLRKEASPHALPVTRIAEYTLRPIGSISQDVDRVQAAGLVTRATDDLDKRRVLVTLTPAGRDLADRALRRYNAIRERVFAHVTSDDLAVIDEAVTTLVDALDTDLEERSA